MIDAFLRRWYLRSSEMKSAAFKPDHSMSRLAKTSSNATIMNILDHEAISGAYFFPSPRSPRDVRTIDVDDATIAVHCSEIDPNKLTMLHFHGNGETIADYAGADYHSFDDLGVKLVWVEYRGYGRCQPIRLIIDLLLLRYCGKRGVNSRCLMHRSHQPESLDHQPSDPPSSLREARSVRPHNSLRT